MPRHDRGAPAGASVASHLARGAAGFGLIGGGFVLAASHGPAALLLAAPGMVALGGCPTCWLAALLQILSAGRVQRACSDGGCALVASGAQSRPIRELPGPDPSKRVRTEALVQPTGIPPRGPEISFPSRRGRKTDQPVGKSARN